MNEQVEETVKYVYRLMPCPPYDVEAMESWLADMAKRGLLLSKDGFFAGMAIFEKREPQWMRYRMDAIPKGANQQEPDTEAQVLSREYGWEYVASQRGFYIYRNGDPEARELNTDPQVQALALRTVRRRERDAVIGCLLYILVYPLLVTRGGILLPALELGCGLMLYMALWALWWFLETLAGAVHLGRLRKKLMFQEQLNHDKPWKKSASTYRIRRTGLTLASIVSIFLLIQVWSREVLEENKIPIQSYTGSVPFATIKDFIPQGEYTMDVFGIANTVEVKSDWIAPTIIHWEEIADVKQPQGGTLSGGLYVDYYETASPWLARQILKEYSRTVCVQEKLRAIHPQYKQYYTRYQQLPAPQVQADYVEAYQDRTGTTLLVQKGTIAMRVSFHQYTSSGYQMELQQWAEILTKSIGNGSS